MAKQVAKTKIKKKKWYPVVAPKLFNQAVLGESYLGSADEMIGRKMTVNMMNVVGDPKRQHINIHFQIRETKDGKGITFVRGYKMSQNSIKRFVKRGRSKVDDSIILKTKEGLSIRIKPLVVTTNVTPKPIQSKIRQATRIALKEKVNSMLFTQLLDSIFRFELQKQMKSEVGKIYPVRNFEIRAILLLDEDKVPEDMAPTPKVKKERPVAKEEPKVEKVEETKTKDDKKEVKEVKEEKPKKAKAPAEKKEAKEKKPAKKVVKEKAKKDSKAKTAAKKPAKAKK